MFMYTISALCVFATLASGQSASAALRAAQTAPAAAAPAVAKQVGFAPTPAPAFAAPVTTPFYPAQFFGPGINNPLVANIPIHIRNSAVEVLAEHPNLRVFVGLNGQESHFTDQFGQEVEVVDAFGRNPIENEGHEDFLQLQREAQFAQARLQAFQAAQQVRPAQFGGPQHQVQQVAAAPVPGPSPLVRQPSRFRIQV